MRRENRIYPCSVRGHSILLEVESDIEIFRADTYATKEPETLEWIQRFFRPEDVIYDIGANIGLYSLFAAKHLRSRCKIYAFEPEALNYAKLNKNIYTNGLSGCVVPCCLAVDDKLSFDLFYLHPNVFAVEKLGEGLVAGSALHAFGNSKDHEGRPFEAVHRQGMFGASLDYLVENMGLDLPNHIKIDVDGNEEKIVEGGERTLDNPRLKSVLVEISTRRGGRDPILQRLTKAGFTQVTDFAEHSCAQLRGGPYEDCQNTVFVRP